MHKLTGEWRKCIATYIFKPGKLQTNLNGIEKVTFFYSAKKKREGKLSQWNKIISLTGPFFVNAFN